MVPRTGQAQWGSSAQDDDRGSGAKAAGRIVEIRDRRRRHRRRRDEASLTILIDRIP